VTRPSSAPCSAPGEQAPPVLCVAYSTWNPARRSACSQSRNFPVGPAGPTAGLPSSYQVTAARGAASPRDQDGQERRRTERRREQGRQARLVLRRQSRFTPRWNAPGAATSSTARGFPAAPPLTRPAPAAGTCSPRHGKAGTSPRSGSSNVRPCRTGGITRRQRPNPRTVPRRGKVDRLRSGRPALVGSSICPSASQARAVSSPCVWRAGIR
jgi:hypothetical protein